MAKLIAQGTKDNLSDMQNYENNFEEGDTGIVLLNLSTDWGIGGFVSGLNTALKAAKVEMPEPVKAEGKTIKIRFRKKFPWLVVIVGAIIGMVLLWVLITSWQLMKDVGIEPAKVMPYLLLGAIILVAYFIFVRKPGIKIGGT